MKEVTWAPLIPLIGGFPLGAEKAFGKPPEAIYSYSDFKKNDSHYVHYVNEIRRANVPYELLDEEYKQRQIDVIVGTPPCAALSQLNTGKTEAAKGAGCQKNEWMYHVFEQGIDTFGAKAVVVENAPSLYTKKGDPVAQRLYEIAKERGYSLSLYKTSTMFHGIPQNRQRTFAIAWKSKKAPIMNWYKRDRKSFKEFLEEVNDHDLHQDDVINPYIYNDHYFQYILHREKKDPRELMIEAGINTAFQFVEKKYGIDNALTWFNETGNEKGAKLASHAIYKFEQGKGIWDGSAHVFDDVMNAVIGRNMVDTVHPTENRSLTIREALHMMGFPREFELIGKTKSIAHIAQNVPVCTSRDICLEIGMFLNGDLETSNVDMIRQANQPERIDTPNVTTSTLESFLH